MCYNVEYRDAHKDILEGRARTKYSEAFYLSGGAGYELPLYLWIFGTVIPLLKTFGKQSNLRALEKDTEALRASVSADFEKAHSAITSVFRTASDNLTESLHQVQKEIDSKKQQQISYDDLEQAKKEKGEVETRHATLTRVLQELTGANAFYTQALRAQ